tara:strand:+ start:58 stop:276 length:219 start_codon:yes stop_codon:yes gene_type:complete
MQTPSKAKLSEDSYVFLQFFIAEKLGITLAQLRSTMSAEELRGWSAYFQLKNEREEQQIQKAKEQARLQRVR